MEKFNILKYIDYAIIEYRKNGLSEYFQQICQEVIDTKDAKYNFKFVKAVSRFAKKMNVIAHGEIVQVYGDAEDNYDYARLIKGADTKGHRQKIVESGSVYYNLLAGKSMEIKDKYAEEFVNLHGEVVSRRGGINTNFEYLKNNNIEGLNKQPHIEVILNSQSSLYNLKVAKSIKGIDVEPHSVIVSKHGSSKENFEFLQVEGCNKNRHLNAIIQSKDEIINLRCLIQLPITDIKPLSHIKVVFNGSDNDAKYEVAVWANRLGYLKELIKRMPEVGEFVKACNSGKINVNKSGFRFLSKSNSEYNC